MKFRHCLAIVLFFGLLAPIGAKSAPIFDEKSQSYFELRSDNRNGSWQAAKNLAESKIYKGVRGRLAVVRSIDVHSFLRRNFKIDVEAWIGLRYWCTFRKVQWVTGEVAKKGEFAVWASPWDRRDIPYCQGSQSQRDGYMPVYYLPTSKGFRWQAVNSGKQFTQYFVEYPVSSP